MNFQKKNELKTKRARLQKNTKGQTVQSSGEETLGLPKLAKIRKNELKKGADGYSHPLDGVQIVQPFWVALWMESPLTSFDVWVPFARLVLRKSLGKFKRLSV